MIPFLNSPVKLEVMPAGAQALQNLLPFDVSQASEFAGIMAELNGQGSDSGGSGKSPLDALFAALGLDQEQVDALKQSLGDGKSLPPGLQKALSDLQQLVSQQGVSGEQLGKALEKLDQLVSQLPAKAQEKLQPVLEKLESKIAELSADEEADPDAGSLLAEESMEALDAGETDETDVESQLASDSEQQADSDNVQKPVQHVDDHEALQVADEEQLQQPVAAPVDEQVVAVKEDAGRQQGGRETLHIPRAVERANARHTPALDNNNASVRSPAFDTTVYGATSESDVSAEAEDLVVNLKNNNGGQRSQLISNLTSSRMGQIIMQGQSALHSALAGSGAEGHSAGQGSTQGNAGGTSFLQMMTQNMPQAITQNIHKAEWGNAVGERITWMIGNRMQNAQLRITPAHLGPIEMKISIEKQSAQVSFVSDHQVVRNALEQAIPRLRDMLQEQDLDLVNVDIHGRDEGEKAASFAEDLAARKQNNHAGSQGADADNAEDSDEMVARSNVVSSSLVDTYA